MQKQSIPNVNEVLRKEDHPTARKANRGMIFSNLHARCSGEYGSQGTAVVVCGADITSIGTWEYRSTSQTDGRTRHMDDGAAVNLGQEERTTAALWRVQG